ncbi:MAG: DUF4307 domain-containing protein [Mycobacterium sp.]
MTEPSAGATPPESRYGRAPMPAATRRRLAMWLTVLVVVAGVGVALVGYQRFVDVDVEGKTATFEVLDDHSVAITITVTRKDPSRPVVCIVRSKSKDGVETGRREILVPATDAKTVQVRTMVPSFTRAFVGDVYGCGTDVPDYLVAG